MRKDDLIGWTPMHGGFIAPSGAIFANQEAEVTLPNGKKVRGKIWPARAALAETQGEG